MHKFILTSALLLFANIGFAFNDFLKKKKTTQTVLLVNPEKLTDLNLFGTHKLKGSKTSSKSFWLSDSGRNNPNVRREGYTSTGFQNLHGMKLSSRVRFSLNGKKGFLGIKIENILVNRSMFDTMHY